MLVGMGHRHQNKPEKATAYYIVFILTVALYLGCLPSSCCRFGLIIERGQGSGWEGRRLGYIFAVNTAKAEGLVAKAKEK